MDLLVFVVVLLLVVSTVVLRVFAAADAVNRLGGEGGGAHWFDEVETVTSSGSVHR